MATLHAFTNNALGTVQNNPLTNAGTNLVVNNALDTILQGLPQFYWLTLWHNGTNPNTDPIMEIVLVTARVSPNNYTITRAQQSTSEQQFNLGDNVGLLWTAGNAAEVIDYTDAVGLGSIIAYNASQQPKIFPAGTNGQVPVYDSTQPSGLNYINVQPITYTVNADETVLTYYSFQVPILTGSSSTIPGWVNSSTTASSVLQNAGGYVNLSGSSTWSISTELPGSGSSHTYNSASTKTIRLKFRAQTLSGTSNQPAAMGIGFMSGSNFDNVQTDTTDGNVRFVNNDGVLYACTSNGTNYTATNVTGSITLANWNLYEIIYTPGTSAIFLINGTVVATITTYIPTSTSTALGLWFAGYSGTATIYTTHPIISIQN